MRVLELLELICVKDFATAPSTVPVGNLAGAVLVLQELENVAAKRRHAGSAADIDHLGVGLVDVELAVRA